MSEGAFPSNVDSSPLSLSQRRSNRRMNENVGESLHSRADNELASPSMSLRRQMVADNSALDGGDDTTATQESPSQRACAGCRRLKQRCDRQLPTCTRCAERGIGCEYPLPAPQRTPQRTRTVNGSVFGRDTDDRAGQEGRYMREDQRFHYQDINALGDMSSFLTSFNEEQEDRVDSFGFEGEEGPAEANDFAWQFGGTKRKSYENDTAADHTVDYLEYEEPMVNLNFSLTQKRLELSGSDQHTTKRQRKIPSSQPATTTTLDSARRNEHQHPGLNASLDGISSWAQQRQNVLLSKQLATASDQHTYAMSSFTTGHLSQASVNPSFAAFTNNDGLNLNSWDGGSMFTTTDEALLEQNLMDEFLSRDYNHLDQSFEMNSVDEDDEDMVGEHTTHRKPRLQHVSIGDGENGRCWCFDYPELDEY